MKIFSSAQIKSADQFTILHEPILSVDLMERAGERLTEELLLIFPKTKQYVVFIGPGNNGGDGLVMARLLKQKNREVRAFILDTTNFSEELKINIERYKATGNELIYLRESDDIKKINEPKETLFIDALFGSGLNRPLEGLAKELVIQLNNAPNFKVSVDIPSGLSADVDHKSNVENTVRANLTLTIQFPKLSFFFSENEPFVGNWKVVDIQLNREFIEQEETLYYALEEKMISDLIRPRNSFAHKGSFGHAFICAGSKGKIGAAILSAKAALRTGCGLLTLQVPSAAAVEVHSKFPEAMVVADENEDHIATPVKNITNYHAIGFGPGIDKNPATAHVLKQLVQNASQPLVIDADGLNILSENKTWLAFVNGSTILTPHPGEFDRLTQKHLTGFERFTTQVAFSKKHGVYVVLKGHHTSITTPGGLCFFNTTGNNGMATAGSGDVLTGIITSLCAQGYSPLHAALLGVYLHGYAGDMAAEKLSKTSLIASDIIDHIPDFFRKFEK